MYAPDHTNPDGTRLYKATHRIPRQGSVDMYLKADYNDKDMMRKIKTVNEELNGNLQRLFAMPQFPQLQYFKYLKKSSQDDGMSLTELVDWLAGENNQSIATTEKKPAIDQVFEKIIVPYLNREGIKLQDRIHKDGSRQEAVKIMDMPYTPMRDNKPAQSGYQVGDEERVDKHLIKGETYWTSYFYEDGEIANYQDLAMVRTRVTERKEGNSKAFSSYKIMKIKKIDQGKLRDIDELEFTSMLIHPAVYAKISGEQVLDEKYQNRDSLKRVRIKSMETLGEMMKSRPTMYGDTTPSSQFKPPGSKPE